jgi:hypothetical protein
MLRPPKLYHFFLLLLFAEATAQTPRVISILAKPAADSLIVSVQLADVFSTQIVNTIRSGLPAVIRFDFRLLEAPDRELQQMTHSLRLLYDLWSDRYRLQLEQRERIAPTFAEMEKLCTQIDTLKLLPRRRLVPQKTYQLRLQVAVIPISARQDQQLRDWLEVAGDAEESAPGEDGAAGFRLNLNKLFSFLSGKKENPFGASEWAVSSPFRAP